MSLPASSLQTCSEGTESLVWQGAEDTDEKFIPWGTRTRDSLIKVV